MRVLDVVGRFTVGLKIMKLQMGFQIQVLFSPRSQHIKIWFYTFEEMLNKSVTVDCEWL